MNTRIIDKHHHYRAILFGMSSVMFALDCLLRLYFAGAPNHVGGSGKRTSIETGKHSFDV